MTPAVVAVILGLLLGVVSGGRISYMRRVALQHEIAVVLLFSCQAFLRGRLSSASGATSLAYVGWVVSVLLLIGALMPDRLQHGIGLVMTAMALNLVIVLANGGMPVDLGGNLGLASQAAVRAAGSGGFYHLARPGDALLMLSDCLPLRVGSSTLMLSVGDVLLVVGVCVFLVYHLLPVRSAPVVD
jgi:hypothetical protein